MFKTVVYVFKFPVLCVQKLFCVFKNCFATGFLLTFRIKKERKPLQLSNPRQKKNSQKLAFPG